MTEKQKLVKYPFGFEYYLNIFKCLQRWKNKYYYIWKGQQNYFMKET